MAQPTRSDDQVVRRRLSHNNLRRKQWRRRLPRAERKRPRRSGKFSALTFGVLVEHPIFLSQNFFSIPQVAARPMRHTRTGQPTKRGRRNAGPTCQAAECARSCGRTLAQSTPRREGFRWRRRQPRAQRRRRRRRSNVANLSPKKRGALTGAFFFIREW